MVYDLDGSVKSIQQIGTSHLVAKFYTIVSCPYVFICYGKSWSLPSCGRPNNANSALENQRNPIVYPMHYLNAISGLSRGGLGWSGPSKFAYAGTTEILSLCRRTLPCWRNTSSWKKPVPNTHYKNLIQYILNYVAVPNVFSPLLMFGALLNVTVPIHQWTM